MVDVDLRMEWKQATRRVDASHTSSETARASRHGAHTVCLSGKEWPPLYMYHGSPALCISSRTDSSAGCIAWRRLWRLRAFALCDPAVCMLHLDARGVDGSPERQSVKACQSHRCAAGLHRPGPIRARLPVDTGLHEYMRCIYHNLFVWCSTTIL